MRATLCFGGSIVAPDLPDIDCIGAIARVLRELRASGHELLVVVGGGKPSRRYIEAALKLGASDLECDAVGIGVTRLNARLLIAALGELAEPSPASTVDGAVRSMMRGRIPVMGGTTPGHTTDTVAAMLAQSSRSDVLIFLTDVDGVYTADPKLDPNARKLESITASKLVELVAGVRTRPGMSFVVDPVAARVIESSRIMTLILGKHEIERLPRVLRGEGHSGTTVLVSKT